jgi:cysteine-rich repeat protein
MSIRRCLWLTLVMVGCGGGDDPSDSGFTSNTAPMTTMPPATGMTTTGAPTDTGEPTTTGLGGTATSAPTTGDDTSTGGDPSTGGDTSTGDPSTTTTSTTTTAGESSTGTTDLGESSSTGEDIVCGDGVKAGMEACDDGNADNTDACLANCVVASCGDTFVQTGVEACDGGVVVNGTCTPMCAIGCNINFADCNKQPGDGCEIGTASDKTNCGGCGIACANNQTCTDGKCVGGGNLHGPEHMFNGLQSNHFITQGCCSLGCTDNPPVMADYFCKHFYGATCTVQPGFFTAQTPFDTYPKMHKVGGCTGNGTDIQGTLCDGGPCKIGNWSEITTGLTNLVCSCQ